MKYKVGDKVRVRKDLEVGEYYGNHWYFNSDMKRYKGKEMTVARVNSEMYDMEEDNGRWGWVDTMLEEIKTTYTVIDVLNMIAKNELEEGTKVIYKDMEFVYDGEELWGEEDLTIHYYIDYNEELNKEVKLIEPDECVSDEGKTLEATDNEEIEELNADEINGKDLDEVLSIFGNKINELIYKLNKED